AVASDASGTAASVGAAGAAMDRLTAAVESLGGLEERLAEIEAGQAALDQRSASSADAVASRMDEGLASLAARVDALAAAAEERSASLEERLAALSVPTAPTAAAAPAAPTTNTTTEAAAAPEPAPAAESTPSEAASVESDFTLRFGESAEIEGLRVFASRMHQGDVVLRVAGLGNVTVGPSAGRAALGNGCTLDLVGTGDRQVLLDADCSGEAAPAALGAEPAALDGTEEPFTLSPGETAGIGEGRVFFSRVTGQQAHLRVAGADDIVLTPDGYATAIGAGCVIALAGIDGRAASFRSNCSVNLPTVQGAATTPEAEIATDAATDEGAEDAASGADALIASAGPDAVVIGVGQTQSIGDAAVFFSRKAANDVVLFVRGAGQVTIGPEAGSATIGGCNVSLVGVADRRVVLKPDC
ncbi:MAG: hypothetical protein AAF844_07885, partial [Pseudomonadota bacterium]